MARRMLKTFNAGIGMVVAVAPDRPTPSPPAAQGAGETVHRIGGVTAGEGRALHGPCFDQAGRDLLSGGGSNMRALVEA